MGWRSPYQMNPDYIDEDWRRQEIERNRDYQKRRLEQFRHELRGLFEVNKPASLEDARDAIQNAFDEGVVREHRMGGDLALSRLLHKIGIDFPPPKRYAKGFRIAKKDDDMLSSWASQSLFKDPRLAPATLDEVFRVFMRWALANEYADRFPMIGPRKLAAWLRREGWPSARHSCGVVFLEIGWKRPSGRHASKAAQIPRP